MIIWTSCQALLLTGFIILAHGAEEKESLSSNTTEPDYHANEDYPDNYEDYQNRDYPDYYGSSPDREGRRRSLPDDEEHAPDSMSEERFLKQLQSTIPGIPGVDYPLYQSVPETSFKCQNQRNPGFYGDVEAQCQKNAMVQNKNSKLNLDDTTKLNDD
ncbi:chitin-binding type-2 domain-containing protein [Trichonephila clavata]|uniref:Chitin-binding type-2 domain-containing protein n=1 Tax=Trichonephila clavata TaxID=2740835 RepID=A0A8X6JFV1_TRICU|nr:chitin-binding type-2 domain-containing protein [Trichonephila clavata]